LRRIVVNSFPGRPHWISSVLAVMLDSVPQLERIVYDMPPPPL
jgi:hypothetical protein